MRIILICAFLVSSGSCSVCCQKRNLVKTVNNHHNRSWTAEENRFSGMHKRHIRKLMGVHNDSKDYQLPLQPVSKLARATVIPSSFDARQKWPQCKTIGAVRDQGACGSCWAFATIAAMSDRICIQSNGRISLNISSQHVLSCCSTCGDGCDGGYPTESWNFWIKNGIVTGGEYNTKEGCQTYTSDPYNMGITPNCSRSCRPGYSVQFSKDFRKGQKAYSVPKSIRGIQTEIMTRGPVSAVMKVYEDFMNYGSGVYHHVFGDCLGYHAVKICGWGTEKGKDYWLVVNSWGKSWGDKGMCKIIRNSTDIDIESEITAGLPLV